MALYGAGHELTGVGSVEKQHAISVTPVSGSTYINVSLQLYKNRRGGMPGIKSVLLYYNRIMAIPLLPSKHRRFAVSTKRYGISIGPRKLSEVLKKHIPN